MSKDPSNMSKSRTVRACKMVGGVVVVISQLLFLAFCLMVIMPTYHDIIARSTYMSGIIEINSVEVLKYIHKTVLCTYMVYIDTR